MSSKSIQIILQTAVSVVRSAALIKYASDFLVVCLFSLGLPFIAVSLAGSALRTEAVSGVFFVRAQGFSI